MATALLIVPAYAWAQEEANPQVLGGSEEQATESEEAPSQAVAANRGESPTPPITAPELRPAVLSPMQRGDILMAHKRYREAIETYSGGLREAAILYNKMGIAYQNLQDFRAAIQNYEKALEVDPTYSEAINNIGTVHYARRDYRRAIRFYERALKANPDSASIYNNLGTAFFARKQYEKANEALIKALELDPNVFEHRGSAGSLIQERSVEERARYYFFLSKAYASQGNVEFTLAYMRKALEDGFKDRDKFRKDPEFAAFQELAEFQALLEFEPRVL